MVILPARLYAVAAGIVADRLAGERLLTPHPVALFGRVMETVERRLYRDDRLAGAAHVLTGLAVGTAAAGAVPVTVATYLTVAGRMLGDTAADVDTALAAGDLDRARAHLPALVGRDPRALDEPEICRATVESVAENTVDAVVAPALWAAVAGAPGAFGYRAVNTLDSMVGHRDTRYGRYGWASARLDDAANWVPARVTVALVAAVRPRQTAAVARAVRRDAPGHPSPNAGVAEAAFAAALGVQLGGVNRYGDIVERRPPLGDGHPPQREDIGRAIRLSRDVTLALAGLLVATATLTIRRRRR